VSEKIEFEAVPFATHYSGGDYDGEFCGCAMNVPNSVKIGNRYRVALEPIEPELKPRYCMCGGRVSVYSVYNFAQEAIVTMQAPEGRHTHWQVFCPDCGCRGPVGATRREAIEKWNHWWAV